MEAESRKRGGRKRAICGRRGKARPPKTDRWQRIDWAMGGEQSQRMNERSQATAVFRTRVPARRLQRAERILHRLGLTPAAAVNMLLAQIELKKGLPFEVMQPGPLLSAEEQGAAWTEAFGAY